MLVPRLLLIAGLFLVGAVEPPNQTQPTAASRCVGNAADGLGFGHCGLPFAEKSGREVASGSSGKEEEM
jgi:hypothetical protein